MDFEGDLEGDEPSPKHHRAYAYSNVKAPAFFSVNLKIMTEVTMELFQVLYEILKL